MHENTPVFPGDAARGEIEVLEESVVWGNDVVRLFDDRVRYPAARGDGHVEQRQFRLGHAPGKDHGVVIVPVTGDDRILLVRQFRHPVRMWLRELPRGGRATGESPAEAARRELREETGCEAHTLHYLGRVVPDSGQLAGVPYLFAARVTRAAAPEPEPTEAVDRIIAYTFAQLRRACERGEIIDGFTLAAVARLAPHFPGDRFAFDPSAAPREDGDGAGSG